MADSADHEESAGARKGVRGQTTADLDRVTDYVEERELDDAKFRQSMNVMLEKGADKKSKTAAEKEMEKVKVAKEDIQLIVDQMEMDENAAERAIREHMGDVKATLMTLVSQ